MEGGGGGGGGRELREGTFIRSNMVIDFTASNGWLEKWKQTYGVTQKRLCREADEVYTTTVQAWIEQLPELCHDHEPRHV